MTEIVDDRDDPRADRRWATIPAAVVDVVAQLDQKAAANAKKLNWKTPLYSKTPPTLSAKR